jgi:hypothetical protein
VENTIKPYLPTTHGAAQATDVAGVEGSILKGQPSPRNSSRLQALFEGAHAHFRNAVEQQGTASFEQLLSIDGPR